MSERLSQNHSISLSMRSSNEITINHFIMSPRFAAFATRLSHQDRETLIKALMLIELDERIGRQPPYFISNRVGETKNFMTFSTSNLNSYFTALNRVYGGFLFCLYFEYFGRFLRSGSSNQALVEKIRETLVMEARWPEMVTFEEMILDLPEFNPLVSAVGRVMFKDQTKTGFIAAAKSITSAKSD